MPAKRIYLAGPMTGLPEYNYPAFNAEAARLRALGYHVENPAENPEQQSWEAYLRQAIRQMLTCDMVALLPGWNGSRGAVFERSVALQVGMALVMADQITDAMFAGPAAQQANSLHHGTGKIIADVRWPSGSSMLGGTITTESWARIVGIVMGSQEQQS